MTESYTLFLNTQNPKNIASINSLNECTFGINWQSFLPTKYQKYEVRVRYCRNQTAGGSLIPLYSVACYLGSRFSIDQSGAVNSILATFPYKSYMTDNSNGSRSIFETSIFESTITTIDYPADNYITLKLLNGTTSTSFLNNTMLVFLNFTPIK
jgi:hypothetical protein